MKATGMKAMGMITMPESLFTTERLGAWAVEATFSEAESEDNDKGNDKDNRAVAIEQLVSLFQNSQYVPDTKLCAAEILSGNAPLFEDAVKRDLENNALAKIDDLVIEGGEIVGGAITKISHDDLDRVSADCPTPRVLRYAEHIQDIQRAFIWKRVSGRPAPLAAAMLRVAAIRPELKPAQRLTEKVKLKTLDEAIWEDDKLCALCGSALGYYNGQFEPFIDYLRVDDNDWAPLPFGQPEVANKNHQSSRKSKSTQKKEKIATIWEVLILGILILCAAISGYSREQQSKTDATQTVQSAEDTGASE